MTQEVGIRLYRARWGVLGAFMLVVRQPTLLDHLRRHH